MEINKIIQGDCLEVMKTMENNSVDSIVTDPPYELGFMGKSWDNTGIANNKEMWAECLRVLKPGGHLLAFSGTRTYHRMASAIEDAGFEIRDMIEWVYGSGFPKSLNIGKAVDKLQGNEREILGNNPNYRPVSGKEGYLGESNFRQTDGMSVSTKGTSKWEGWGTALKPSHEPICMARKPLAEKTVAENCLKYGTGGINIDESRVNTEYYLQGNDLYNIIRVCQLNHLQLPANNAEKQKFQEDMTSSVEILSSVLGNVSMPILEKILGTMRENISNEVMLCCGETWTENTNICLNTVLSGKEQTEKYLVALKFITLTAIKRITDWKISNSLIYPLIDILLTQVKKLRTTKEGQGRFPANLLHDNSEEVRECFPETKSGGGNKATKTAETFLGTGFGGTDNSVWECDSGNASRFFKSIIYQAKASKSERNNGCEELEEKEGIRTNAPRENEDIKTPTRANNHPTVKPIALMEYLIKMVTPKGGTVLDPFAGSGSTLVAAKNNGFQYIGIEMTEEYIPIIEARLGH